MEQSLLNYAFRRGGPMPWRELHYKWSATWPSEKDVEGNVVSLHEKFWSTGPEELQEMWTQQKENMEAYFAARASAMHT
jgi:alpha-N-acetylglucosamine transferase